MTPVNQQRQIHPAQRAELFAQMTRQHWQPLPSQSVVAGQRVSFTLPKVRLLSKISLLVEGTLRATHATHTSYPHHAAAPYNLISQARVDTNLGFSLVRLSGRSGYFKNLLDYQASAVLPFAGTIGALTGRRDRAILGISASAAPGSANPFRFTIDYGVAINERDPIGLINLQNEETVVTLDIDIGTADTIALPAAGFTYALEGVTITPLVETFSIPHHPDARPDLGIVKLMQEQRETIPGAGPRDIRLPVGTTYRKLLLFLENAAGMGFEDGQLSGDIEIVLNQADIPYRIRPRSLVAINALDYGISLPAGLFVFDFTAHMGLPNFSGARDYVDSAGLTEFWLRINPTVAGTATIIYELLSPLGV